MTRVQPRGTTSCFNEAAPFQGLLDVFFFCLHVRLRSSSRRAVCLVNWLARISHAQRMKAAARCLERRCLGLAHGVAFGVALGLALELALEFAPALRPDSRSTF